MIIDLNLVSLDKTVEIIVELVNMWKAILYYLLFTIALEFVLRVISGIIGLFRKKSSL